MNASSPKICCSITPADVPDDHPQQTSLLAAPGGLARAEPRTESRPSTSFHIAAISEHFRGAGAQRKKARAQDLPLDQRLPNYIIEGTKDGLIADLDRKRKEGAAPLDIINGPLMAGMAEVGRLFNANELIVAEVLQSAEAMKAAVSHLEQFMEKADTESAPSGARHREGRRSRHRQESRRNHSEEQRL
jgi:cobalamin-dependent methionine synthase I